MKQLVKNLWLALILLQLASCEKDNSGSQPFPEVNTLDITNVSSEGATFNAEIKMRGQSPIERYGFVWSAIEHLDTTIMDKVILSDNIESGKFSATISSTLKEGETYAVYAFAKTGEYAVFGKSIQFKSLGSKGPVVTSFSPETGSWGDTITIRGKNFSYVGYENTVKLGTIQALVTSASDTLLTIRVPEKLIEDKVNLSVSIFGNTSIAPNMFNYLVPEITKIEPLNGSFGDTITISGNNFTNDIRYNKVFFGNVSAIITSFSNKEIKVIVPGALNQTLSSIKLESTGHQLVYGTQFRLDAPVVESYNPASATKPNQEITITGKNFNPVTQYNTVFIDGYQANITDATDTTLKVILPDEVIPFYQISRFANLSVSLSIADQTIMATDSLPLFWHSTWTRKKDFPGAGRYKGIAFTSNGKGYYGTGISNVLNDYTYYSDFWEYDPTTDSWARKTDVPGNPRAGAVSFIINNQGYVGTGSDHMYSSSQNEDTNHFKDFYRYDATTDSWTRIADFAGIGRHSAAAFSYNDMGYVGTGYWGNDKPDGAWQVADDMWRYDPVNNNWTEIGKFPRATNSAIGINDGNSGYIYDTDSLFVYTESEWGKLNAPVLQSWDNIGFSLNGNLYFGMGSTNSALIWEYNPISGTATKRPIDPEDGRLSASVFVIDGKAYIVGGTNGSQTKNDVWEFDPTLPAE
ncbi:IPT/TIG domain-containing protein [Prolixibacter denitrificans]|uniref:Kelch motif protein n=1 Tax=Prolixibacter denitrificans TaxID=1541063 RepID=A0A2P8C6L8_9BACT|nr:IPT/TIG domain-containing protein [Prolixibacter denitrificans]PSK80595.1 Kelch motif protein [Prolixibacter denitrificans]GET22110.1 hypothetical protein JCM18694_23560 [Prolixibacter denitrificans]